jgi:hypothetical protein
MNKFELTWKEISDLSGEEEIRGGSMYIAKSDMDMNDFIEEVIIPLCKSVGYRDKTIDEYFGG